ncbi:MAG: zinc-binding dehydrogenase [Thaumarchaeota archaeon]|nr:MAG: zinc-binding dehydrogenase [Nitrososphaerota archaeon]TLX86188.1 MAG: zinc-binding dehydrogenase [Nitrososphaerota archaeon]TLX89444.1 MAG: zinc-binding dehydrogenase [Nitrososphaerota archaeon]
MKAVPFYSHGNVSVLKYVENFPTPVPNPSEILVRIKYCGINHLDIWTRMGIPGISINLPHICGSDIVGTLENDYSTFSRGSRVLVYPGISCNQCNFCNNGNETLCKQFSIIGGLSNYNGGYGEYVIVPKTNIIPIPHDLSDEQAAILSISYLTAWNIIKKLQLKKDDTVLVYGASGGLGMAMLQIAKAFGIKIIGTVSDDSKLNFAYSLGSDYVINRNKKEIVPEVEEITHGLGVDAVVDTAGQKTMTTSINSVRKGGKIAMCGTTTGNDANLQIRSFYSKQIQIYGILIGSKLELLELVEFINKKKIVSRIDSVFSLIEVQEAHKRLEKGEQSGKILIKI